MTGADVAVAVTLSAAMLGLPVCARHAARALGEPDADVRRVVLKGALGAVAWLSFTAALGFFGLTPARLLWFTCTASVATLISASSAFGTRIVRGLSPRWFVGFQAFRIVTALALPLVSLDLYSGILALSIGLIPTGPRVRWWAVLAFSVLGAASLGLVTFRLVSHPSGLLTYSLCQLPLVGLPAALFGHVVAVRWLWRPAA